MLNSSEPLPDDPFLAELIETVRDDPKTLGLLLHGSRALGRHRADSDYDLIRIVTAEAYEARRVAGALVEKITPDGTHRADVLYQTPSRIDAYVMEPGWYTPTYLSARILFDRTGQISVLLARIAAESGRIARERLAANYDDYLNSFVRSMKAARGRDELGRRLHAAASADALVRTLFGLQSSGRRITTASPPTFRSSSQRSLGRPATCRTPFSGWSGMAIRHSSSSSRSASSG